MITVIGLDGSELTPEKSARIAAATLVVGAERHLAAVPLPVDAETVVLGKLEAALRQLDTHLAPPPGHDNPGRDLGQDSGNGHGHGDERPDGHGDERTDRRGDRLEGGPDNGRDRARRQVVVLASGDPGFFGIVRALRARGHRPEVLPALSSVALAFARAGLTWDDALVVSAHGRPDGLRHAANACRAHPKVAILTGPGAGPAEIARELAPTTPRSLIVCEDLGGEHERVTRPRMGEATTRVWRDPNVLIVLDPIAERRSATQETDCAPGSPASGDRTSVSLASGARVSGARVSGPGWIAGARPGPSEWALPEEAFEHRDSMISKAEVRAFVLAKLGPRVGDLVWDIGAGSGSVAIECAWFGAAVFAVERDADACERIRRNVLSHGVKVALARGQAPAALEPLPDPDAVFVGGGGPEVVDACAARGARVVVATLASLERVPRTLEILRTRGYHAEGVQLQSSRLTPLPDGTHRLAGTNPVTVIWGTRAGGTR